MTTAPPQNTNSRPGELRRSRLTGEWVAFAPARGARPSDFAATEQRAPAGPRDPDCPFCPGNEDMLAQVLQEFPGETQGEWALRAVANRFAALSPEAAAPDSDRSRPAVGRHEVIVESPRHDASPATMDQMQTASLMQAWRERWRDARRDPQVQHVVLFRNHGPSAGASLRHPHAQLAGLPLVPEAERRRLARMTEWFDLQGTGLLESIMEQEARGPRKVFENDGALAWVPWAANVPCEVVAAPKRRQADFGDCDDEALRDFGLALEHVLAAVYAKLSDPDYNLVLQGSPCGREADPALHWYATIRPRLTVRAGFEIGAGMRINPSWPEEDARFLR
ncbi:MAG: DUF4931 domain-containing protein [Desulfovibrionaceae bacterium]